MNEFLESIIKRDPAAKDKISVILTYPGVKAVFFHYFSHMLWGLKLFLFARIVSQFSRFLTGIEIHPSAKIGKNLFIDHGMGVVIGETSEIGDNVTIGHGVMCHGRNIGNRVLIGNGAILNDGVLVGEESVIGSGSMILENMDIPEKSIVVGMPVRIRGSVKDKHVNMIDRIAAGDASKAQKYKAEGNLE